MRCERSWGVFSDLGVSGIVAVEPNTLPASVADELRGRGARLLNGSGTLARGTSDRDATRTARCCARCEDWAAHCC